MKYRLNIKPCARILIVFSAFSAAALADPIAEAKEEYSYFSCAEIKADRARIEGRLNQIDLDGIKEVRGDSDAAVAKMLVFWPAMLFSNKAEHLDETASLRRVLSLQNSVLNERGCSQAVLNTYSKPSRAKKLSSDVGESYYAAALTEFEENTMVKSLWAKAMALSNGSEFAAKASYIKLRAEQLAAEGTKE